MCGEFGEVTVIIGLVINFLAFVPPFVSFRDTLSYIFVKKEHGFYSKEYPKGCGDCKMGKTFTAFLCVRPKYLFETLSGQKRQGDGRGYGARHFAAERMLKVTGTWNKTAMEMNFRHGQQG